MKDLVDLESLEQLDLEMTEEKKESLEHFTKNKLQGHVIQSKAQWVEEGEKPTKYFCNFSAMLRTTMKNYIAFFLLKCIT